MRTDLRRRTIPTSFKNAKTRDNKLLQTDVFDQWCWRSVVRIEWNAHDRNTGNRILRTGLGNIRSPRIQFSRIRCMGQVLRKTSTSAVMLCFLLHSSGERNHVQVNRTALCRPTGYHTYQNETSHGAMGATFHNCIIGGLINKETTKTSGDNFSHHPKDILY